MTKVVIQASGRGVVLSRYKLPTRFSGRAVKLELRQHLPLEIRVDQLGPKSLPGLHGSDPRRCPSQDQVPLFQLHDARNERDERGNIKQHIYRCSPLFDGPVNGELEPDASEVLYFGLGYERTNRARGVEAFRGGPRQSGFLDFILDVPGGQIDCKRWTQPLTSLRPLTVASDVI